MQFDEFLQCKTSQNLWKNYGKSSSPFQDVPIKKTSLHTAHKNPTNSLVAIHILGLHLGVIVVASIQLHQVILNSNSYSFNMRIKTYTLHRMNFSP